MTKILLAYRLDQINSQEIPTYSESFWRALIMKKHDVTRIGQGQSHAQHVNELTEKELKQYDLFIDLDCGRGTDGKLHFQFQDRKCPIPSAIRFIDSHGYPSLHRRTAKNYEHTFFAVWDRRDLFSTHQSAHWCPNASDDIWFDYTLSYEYWDRPKICVGFFGSKGGLDRADMLRDVCNSRSNYSYDIREIGKSWKVRWPRTAHAMANCKILFNYGQKHDGPNQRVIESMLMNRPLINNRDKRDGMDKLFEAGTHYLSYESKAELANQIAWCFNKETVPLAENMAQRAYNLVKEKHLVKHRVDQILEVCLQ